MGNLHTVLKDLYIGQNLIIPSYLIQNKLGLSDSFGVGGNSFIGVSDNTDLGVSENTNLGVGDTTNTQSCQSGMHEECVNNDCKCVQNDNTIYWVLGGLGVIALAAIGVSFYRAYKGMPEPGVVWAQGGGATPVLPLREPTRVGGVEGDMVWITYKGKKTDRFMPDVKITKDDPSYMLYPLHGYSGQLAVEDDSGHLIGWMPINVLGFENVKEWMKAVNYIV